MLLSSGLGAAAACTLTDYGHLQSGTVDGADRTRASVRDCSPGLPDDGYVPSSEYLLEAQPNIDYVVSCAQFWFGARAEAGGYYTNVARDGTPEVTGPKEPMTQSRHAYGFVRAFMLTGDETFLEHAEHALDYLYSLRLAEEGGWYPDHSSFFEHYALLGPSTYCEATLDPTHCGWRDRGMADLDEKLWDPDPEQFGYFELGGASWRAPSGKSFGATVDALATHDYIKWLEDPPSRGQRLLELGENLLTHFVPLLGTNTNGFSFPDRFATNWSPAVSYTNYPGHTFKASWNLSRLFAIDGDERWRSGAEQTIDEVLTKAWDETLDYRIVNPSGAPTEWWELEQAFTAGISAWYTGRTPELRARYLKLADEGIAAFHRVFDDPEYGEAFKLPSGEGLKSDTYKASYHTTETGYYSLLYGQLFYRHRSVSLFYRFEPSAEPRTVHLTPIYSPRLRITDVSLDGAPYESYGSMTRRLDIPAGTGGVFEVTFWIDDTAAAVRDGSRQPCRLAPAVSNQRLAPNP